MGVCVCLRVKKCGMVEEASSVRTNALANVRKALVRMFLNMYVCVCPNAHD